MGSLHHSSSLDLVYQTQTTFRCAGLLSALYALRMETAHVLYVTRRQQRRDFARINITTRQVRPYKHSRLPARVRALRAEHVIVVCAQRPYYHAVATARTPRGAHTSFARLRGALPHLRTIHTSCPSISHATTLRTRDTSLPTSITPTARGQHTASPYRCYTCARHTAMPGKPHATHRLPYRPHAHAVQRCTYAAPHTTWRTMCVAGSRSCWRRIVPRDRV